MLRLALLVAGAASIAAAALTSRMEFLAVAAVCFFLLATSLGRAGRLAASLKDFEGRFVDVAVWGRPLEDAALRVDAIGALGAGLLIRLTSPKASKTLLKVAQPGPWRLEEGSLIIEEAAYVQWAGRRLERAQGRHAVAIRSVPPDGS